jgi:hypothetical protein
VFVSDTDAPTVSAEAPLIVSVNAPGARRDGEQAHRVLLAAGFGSCGRSHRQRSVMATVVLFAPGFYVFEVSAKEARESRPARVAFEAQSGTAIPQARPHSQRDEIVGDRVAGRTCQHERQAVQVTQSVVHGSP